MESQNYICSVHKDVDASKYCAECNLYFCNKCEKHHSEIFKNHQTFIPDKNINEIFTGFCKEKNHRKELDYYCNDHNILCCIACIGKIKTRENGKHFDCNVCDINDICDNKKENLSNNIKILENLYNLFSSSVDELNEIMEEINKNKKKVKEEIQKNFIKFRNELNNREEQLLIGVDDIFEKKFNVENIDNILKEKNFLNELKIYLEKGKIVEKEWDKNENKIFFVNDCINIEKAIDKIKNINKNFEKYKAQNKKLNFYCQQDEVINLIKKLGTFDQEKINEQEVNITINNFNPKNLNFVKQISSNFGYSHTYVYDCVCFFVSKNDEYILGYTDISKKTIIFYDINDNKEIKKLNNAHEKDIYSIRHYPYDKYDIILSTSYNNDIKIWYFNECLNILAISKIFGYTNVFSSCIIFDDNDYNIFCTGNYNYIKFFDSKGEFKKNIGKDNISRLYIDSCKIEEKKYLLVGGTKGIEVFNYPELSEYFIFIEENDNSYHNEAKIIKINDIYNLIDIGDSSSIKIWDFHNKILIAKIASNNTSPLGGFTIINSRYLYLGSSDNNIKEFDIEKKIMIKSINKHTSTVMGIKPVKDKNGNILIASYGCDNNIFLWKFN